MPLLGRIGPVELPPNRGNIILSRLFVVLTFFLGHAQISNSFTHPYAKWLKRYLFVLLGVRMMRNVMPGKYAKKTPQKGRE